MEKPNDNMIAATSLTKVFRDFWGRPKVKAVDGLNLYVRRGEVFGLLGPNGSGKSTTLKMLLGLLYPTSGELLVLGKSPREVAVKARIGFMPEDSYLYRYLTAEETLLFYGGLFGIPASERKRLANELLERVGLARDRHRRIGEFSKGMARRIGLAQALLNDPDLILLDEPTSGLDPIGCREVKDLILDLARRGKTVLVSSHHLADMQDVCDRVAILLDGRVCAEGGIHDLLQQPDSVRLSLRGVTDEKLRPLLAYIERETGIRPEVDRAGQTLESLFIQVVVNGRRNRP
jgi:ABC-2 type transport system ATP-binding protein